MNKKLKIKNPEEFRAKFAEEKYTDLKTHKLTLSGNYKDRTVSHEQILYSMELNPVEPF